MNRFTKVFLIKGSFYWMIFAGTIFCFTWLSSCKQKTKPEEKVIVETPEKMDDKVQDLIQSFLEYSNSKKGKLDDSTVLYQLPILMNIYRQKNYSPQWSSSQKWLTQGDSLLQFIENAKRYGLFPADYHSRPLLALKKYLQTMYLKTKKQKMQQAGPAPT